MEKNRPYKKKFYEPRMNPLSIVAQDLQDLEDGKYDFYGLSMPPRVGKSTICIFFYAWIIGKRPSSHNAMSGHTMTLLFTMTQANKINYELIRKQIEDSYLETLRKYTSVDKYLETYIKSFSYDVIDSTKSHKNEPYSDFPYAEEFNAMEDNLESLKHCKFYSNADMAKITATAMEFITWHITYFRDLRIYIRSLESKEEVGRVTYGTGIPEAYQSEPLKAMLAQKS